MVEDAAGLVYIKDKFVKRTHEILCQIMVETLL